VDNVKEDENDQKNAGKNKERSKLSSLQ